MGSADSRFREAVRTGNVEQAHELYYRKRSISKDRLQPNCSFGAGYDENTLLHYTALHGMKQLYVDLILMGGRPDQKVGWEGQGVYSNGVWERGECLCFGEERGGRYIKGRGNANRTIAECIFKSVATNVHTFKIIFIAELP